MDDKELVANPLNDLGVIAWETGRRDVARALFLEGLAVALHRETTPVGDDPAVAPKGLRFAVWGRY